MQDGDKLYRAIGNLPEKDMAMLEERIKRLSKTRAPPGSNAAPAAVKQEPVPVVASRGIPPPSSANANSQRGPGAGAARGGGIPSRLQRPGSSTAIPQQQQQMQQQPGPPQSASAAYRRGSPSKSARPVSGAFTLDLDKIEAAVDNAMGDGGPGNAQLVNHNLEDIFNDAPVRLPQTMTARRQFASPTSAGKSSVYLGSPIGAPQPPPSQPMLSDMPEAYEALDVVLAQIQFKESSVCLAALKQLDELIKDEDKVRLMERRMDQLLVGCYVQYKSVLQVRKHPSTYHRHNS